MASVVPALSLGHPSFWPFLLESCPRGRTHHSLHCLFTTCALPVQWACTRLCQWRRLRPGHLSCTRVQGQPPQVVHRAPPHIPSRPRHTRTGGMRSTPVLLLLVSPRRQCLPCQLALVVGHLPHSGARPVDQVRARGVACIHQHASSLEPTPVASTRPSFLVSPCCTHGACAFLAHVEDKLFVNPSS